MDFPPFLKLHPYFEDYHNISSLGNGSFGTVMLAKYCHSVTNLLLLQEDALGTMLDPLIDSTYHLNNLVAIKTMKKTLSPLQGYANVKEYRFITSVPSHPSLVQIYEMFIDNKDFKFHIVMESMNQNLYNFMKSRKYIRFLPSTLKCILRQIAEGIRHIHRFGYFHRDIKPENILICSTDSYYSSGNCGSGRVPNYRQFDNYVVKLADFGLARHVSNLNKYTAYVSTRWYRSPEILLRRNRYSKPVDIWAFGCVAVEIATFHPLFPGSNETDQIWKVLEVLGCPSKEIENQKYDNLITTQSLKESEVENTKESIGGYWEEAQHLAANLGFQFPLIKGVSGKQLLPEENHSELRQIVERCLTWNPDIRIGIEELCSMSYFQSTILSKPYEEPARLYDATNLTMNPKHLIDENTDPIQRNEYNDKEISKDGNSRIVSFNVYASEDDNFEDNKFGLNKLKNDNTKEEEDKEDEGLNEGDFVDELIQFPIRSVSHIGAEYSWETTTKYDAALVLAGGNIFISEDEEDGISVDEKDEEDEEGEQGREEEEEWAIVKNNIFQSISFDGIPNRS